MKPLFLMFSLVPILCIAMVSPVAASQEAQYIKNNLCEKFSGVFFWDHSNQPQYVNKFVEEIAITDNVVIVSGSGSYTSAGGVTFIKFEWRINAIDYRIEIQESEPTSTSFVTDGTYNGSISVDLSKIRTMWETRSTGRTGVLNLDADPSCKPSNLS